MAEHNVVFNTLDADQPWSMDTYLAADGYQAWKKILEEKTAQEYIIDAVKESSLRGRGGAGFRGLCGDAGRGDLSRWRSNS